jgi:riboflavin biosynthesis pyrimidine reductase
MWLFVAPTVFGDVASLGLASRLETLSTGPLRWRLRGLYPLDPDWLCVLEPRGVTG